MTLTRRRFLQIAGGTPLALAPLGEAHAATSLAFAPAAFDAGPDSALIWLCGQDAGRVRIDYGSDGSFANGPVVTLAKESDFTTAVPLTGLAPGKEWTYRVVDAESGKPLAEPGRFKTAPTAPAPFTFAFSADMEEKYRPFSIFDAIAARQPDFFLMLGDTIYADHPSKNFSPTVSHYRGKHSANRKDSHLQAFLAKHATYAIWDDHECDDNANNTHAGFGNAFQVFKEYWPCRPADAKALHRKFSWAGVDFIMLDTRSFRSPQSMAQGPDKTMLGAEQKAWLLESLKGSTAPFKFVVTSVPFQGGGVDTWGNYKDEQQEIARFIRGQKIGGVVFLTGDYHLARDWSTNPKAGFREYMAGPIASFTSYQRTPANRDRYEKAGTFHYGDGFNFGLWRVDPAAAKAKLAFVGVDGKTLFETEIAAG
jgi:alkaline phosphatase D